MGVAPAEFCSSLDAEALGFNVTQQGGAELTLDPAPPVVNYACSISINGGAYVELWDFESLCISDPSQCQNGNSTWSVWLKIHRADNVGDVVFMSSGTQTTAGVFVAQVGTSGFQYGVTAGTASWFIYPGAAAIPDGQWFHLAILINYEDKKLSGYINGKPNTINEDPHVTRPSEALNPDKSLMLGGQSDMTGKQVANASYSDLQIYERILEPKEIEQIHTCGSIGK